LSKNTVNCRLACLITCANRLISVATGFGTGFEERVGEVQEKPTGIIDRRNGRKGRSANNTGSFP